MISASIVLYNTNEDEVIKAINSLLKSTLNIKIFLVDNSESPLLKKLSHMDISISYIFNDNNIGYGAGHNIALRRSRDEGYKYHLVLNPDVYFDNKFLLETIVRYLEKNNDVGLLMPKVLYPDGKLQYLCKLLPSPFDFFIRRLIPFVKFKQYVSYNYELRFFDYNSIRNIPSLSGCFMLLRNSIFETVSMFDENFFLHVEDIDLSRRIHDKYKTVFFPSVHIFHEYQGIATNKKILILGISSGIYYFNKWGWFFDKKRKYINMRTISSLRNK